MEASQVYIMIAVAAMVVVLLVVFFLRKDKMGERLTPLASFSLILVIAGIINADNRLLGYSLIGAGILLAIVDIIKKSKKKKGR